MVDKRLAVVMNGRSHLRRVAVDHLPAGRNKALRSSGSGATIGSCRNCEDLFRPTSHITASGTFSSAACHRHHAIGSLSVLIAFFLVAATSAEGAEPVAAAKLTLANGDFATGRLIDSDQPQVLRWQGDGFVSPFDFMQRDVVSIHFSSPDERPVPTGDYCFELAGGDLLFGQLVGLSEQTAELELPLFGRTQLTRSSIRRIRRWGDGADLLYLGPNGLADWDLSSPVNAWRDESGHLITDQDGAFIQKDFKLPAQAVIEFEISWKSKPNFVLALGVEGGNLALGGAQSFRFEVWQNNLVAMRETDDEADVASVARVEDGPGRTHLIAYLDQRQHRMFVASPAGNKLADLHVSSGLNFNYPVIRLTNHRGDVRLERLRISRWNGDEPREVQADKARLHRADGSIVYGNLKSFDSAVAQFVIAGDDGETRVAAADVGSIVLSGQEISGQSVRAVMRDGTRLSGQLAGVQGGKLLLTYPAIGVPLAIPVTELHSLLSLDAQPSSTSREGRSGRLELTDAKLTGALMPGKEAPDASSLVWQPHASATASALVPGTAGRIVYRDPPPPEPKVKAQTVRRVVNRGGVLEIFNRLAPSSPSPRAVASTKRALHLRTGDALPCEVTAIDEKGVTFKTEMTDATFVPHDKIKAVELSDLKVLTKLDKVKQERLLTLPRMQRNNPPTHLIRFFNGDYLRARIESMNEEFLTVEVRLESKQLKRSHIVEIIWLHQDELGDEPEASEHQSLAPTHVQAVRSNGTRLTFQPQECDGKLVAGTSELLGRCHVELADVDLLLIGEQVNDAAARLTYGLWRLQHAIDPKFVSADGVTARPLGTESDMVGKPAPDFTLELLDGTSFQLSRRKGRIVVLDFWATWCGPCIQAMPQVDEVVHEFKDHDVELIAVNLQEAPDKIKSTLDRLKLDPAVALDIDGVVADRYAATSIPQTVIIDREGTVARLFVGADPDFADQLRTALQGVVDGEVSEDPE